MVDAMSCLGGIELRRNISTLEQQFQSGDGIDLRCVEYLSYLDVLICYVGEFRSRPKRDT